MNGSYQERVFTLSLKLLGRSLCLSQVYGPNSSELHLEYVEEIMKPCEGFKVKPMNPRSVCKILMHTLGTKPGCGGL